MRMQAAAVLAAASATAALAMPAPALAQPFPARPVRFVIPFSAGSQTDILARLLGQKLVETWGQPIVTDNRPSAGGVVAGSIVATSAPDGHTLMMISPSHAVNATLYAKLPYDTLRDFHGVAQVSRLPAVLVVSPASGVKSVKDLVALAKQQPGRINFGSSGIGSSTHLRAEHFKHATGIDVSHIPYKGPPEALGDTMAGRIHFMFSPFSSALPFYRQGRIVAIAITGEKRFPLMPDVPTFIEAGMPDFALDGWYGLVAPGRTPKALMERIAADVGQALKSPEVIRNLEAQGATPHWAGPDAFQALIRDEVERIGRIVKLSGARAN